MFDRKYKEALKIIDEEVNFYDDLYHTTMSLAFSTKDVASKEHHLRIADDFLGRYLALLDVRRKLTNNLGDL